jgi:hypothetical protein
VTQPWFIATETFTPSDGDNWQRYIAWSGLSHLDEVVSLDCMLCPTVLPEIRDDYWPHIVSQNFLLNYFVDLEFLLTQVASVPRKNLLCVVREPVQSSQSIVDKRFELVGFDLLETETSTSALVNCGGFPRAFQNGELNAKGLLPSLSRALEVQSALSENYPEEHHAQCDVWQIARAVVF